MILRYKELKDVAFYKQHIEEYNPINVINAGDMRDDGQTDADIKATLRKDYGLIGENTVIVSAKKAFEILQDVPPDMDLAKLTAEKFKGENLESFMELKDKIIEDAGVTRDHIEKRLTRFENLYEVVKKDAAQKKIQLPDITGFDLGVESGTIFKLWWKTVDDVKKHAEKFIQMVQRFFREKSKRR